jgi:ubiquinone/menaquinone biosynthesis C-methylase UbiE
MYHWPNFLLILDRIALGGGDRLLEVGCGGGAFIHRALESGCRATAIDHSPEMVRLTVALNAEAVAAGALTALEGEAGNLPVPDGAFTCAVMTGVIGFLPDPVAALQEILRALGPGGRIAVFGGTAALKGTPAAPEPFASRIRFFERAELEEIGRQAGFVEVRVEEPDLEPYARAAKLPEAALEFFRGVGGALLLTGHKA